MNLILGNIYADILMSFDDERDACVETLFNNAKDALMSDEVWKCMAIRRIFACELFILTQKHANILLRLICYQFFRGRSCVIFIVPEPMQLLYIIDLGWSWCASVL